MDSVETRLSGLLLYGAEFFLRANKINEGLLSPAASWCCTRVLIKFLASTTLEEVL